MRSNRIRELFEHSFPPALYVTLKRLCRGDRIAVAKRVYDGLVLL